MIRYNDWIVDYCDWHKAVILWIPFTPEYCGELWVVDTLGM